MSKSKCCQAKTAGEIGQLASLFRVLAEPNRLRILCALKENEKCVCEMQEDLNLAQNLVSHHLGILREFDLVKIRKDGLKVIYLLNKKKIKRFNQSIDYFLQIHEE